MSLDSVLNTSGSGLDSISRRLATVSQNVANANTAGYVRETVSVTSVAAGGKGMGVRTGVATRNLDERLQADAMAASATAQDQQARQAALAGIDAASGVPGSGSDLPSLMGSLRDAFSRLQADPSNASQQRAVVGRADALARGVNVLGQAVSGARQAAQDDAVTDVAAANEALRNVGVLSDRIMSATARGESTADLDDQRDRSIRTLSDLTGAKVLRQASGDVLAVAGGLVLQTRATTGPFALGAATLAPGAPAAAAPQLTLDGAVISGKAVGGRIGANLALRDDVLPDMQVGVDAFASSVAGRFNAAGLALFTDPAGAVPSGASPGFSGTMRVSAAAVATPSMVRDGVGAPGAAGRTALIDGVLNGVLGAGAGSLVASASALAGRHAVLAADATGKLETGQAVQSSLEAKLAAGTGVALDTETADLIRLQNAYSANARVMVAAQAMWTQLLESVR